MTKAKAYRHASELENTLWKLKKDTEFGAALGKMVYQSFWKLIDETKHKISVMASKLTMSELPEGHASEVSIEFASFYWEA